MLFAGTDYGDANALGDNAYTHGTDYGDANALDDNGYMYGTDYGNANQLTNQNEGEYGRGHSAENYSISEDENRR